MKGFDFMSPKNFKLLSQIEGNSIKKGKAIPLQTWTGP
jgi:hypothetical protein